MSHTARLVECASVDCARRFTTRSRRRVHYCPICRKRRRLESWQRYEEQEREAADELHDPDLMLRKKLDEAEFSVLRDAGPEEGAFRRGAKLTQREVQFMLQFESIAVNSVLVHRSTRRRYRVLRGPGGKLVLDPPLRFFRRLKKTAIVLMLLFRLDKPVGESEIAEILDLHPETMRIYLRSLAGLGLVTRTHRYHGWTLTVGGRQMILGETGDGWNALEAGNNMMTAESPSASAENPRSIPKGLVASAENPCSILEDPTARAEVSPTKVKLPRSILESTITSAENPRSLREGTVTSAEKPRSSAEIPRSRPIAAASLSLSFKAESNKAAAAIAKASAEVSTGKMRVLRSLVSRGFQLSKRREGDTRARLRSDPVVRANLEAFGSIGVRRNGFVLEICRMEHVTPDYILGQKKRLEAERRYSHGLLLTVVRSNDYLPAKYLAAEDSDSQAQLFETDLGSEEEGEHILGISTGSIQRVEPDPSIYESLSAKGMTAARAWSAVLGQLKRDMPKAGYDKWVRDMVLLSAEDGVLVIGAPDGLARDWLESRLASAIMRKLIGICNRSVKVKFVNAETD
jgi:DNA-binding MarR family transcriptional regulator